MTSEHTPKQAKDQKTHPSTQTNDNAPLLDVTVSLRLNPSNVLTLQRMVGNRTVQRLLHEQGGRVRRQLDATNQSFSREFVESMSSQEVGQQIGNARTALADTNLPSAERQGISENMRFLQSEAQLRGETPAPPDAGAAETFSIEPIPGMGNWGQPRRERLTAALGTMRIPLSSTYVRYLWEQAIAKQGERKASMVLSDLHDYIYSTLKGAKGRYPPDATNVPDLDAQMEQGDRLFGIFEDQFNLLREENRQFLGELKQLAVQLTYEALAKSDEVVRSEMERYGIKEAQFGGALGTNPADASRASTQGLMRAAGELLAAQQGVQRLRGKQKEAQAELEALKKQDAQLQQSSEAVVHQEETVAYYDGMVSEADTAYKTLRAELEIEFPMLASFGDNEKFTELETLAPLQQARLFDPATMLRLLQQHSKLDELEKGSPLAMAYMGKEAQEKLNSIAEVREELDDDKDLVWKLAPIMAMAAQQMSVGSGTMWDRVLADRIAEAHDTPFWKKALTVLAIGLSIVAAIPSGGTSLAAGGALLTAELAAIAIDAYLIYDAAHGYNVQSALTKTHFDRAQALSAQEPSLGWLAVDILAGIVGAAGVARATRNFRHIVDTRQAVLVARSSDEVIERLRILEEAAVAAGLDATQTNRLLRETEEVLAGGTSVAPFRLPAEALNDPELIRVLEGIGSGDLRRSYPIMSPSKVILGKRFTPRAFPMASLLDAMASRITLTH